MILEIRVVPKSSRNSVSWYDKEKKILKLTLTAPPVDGKANGMALETLADFFGLKKRQLELVSGETARQKKISLDAPQDQILEKLKILK